jgi:ATP sulfurylase
MKIISKVECVDALDHINDIIHRSDFLLLDRGDLSKEIPIEKIPFTQKVVIQKARRYNKGVFVATNLLESMVEKRNPTRAEVHDVINTIVDGALGLVMAAETAIGKHPMECLNMLNRLIQHAEGVMNGSRPDALDNRFIRGLECSPYLHNKISSALTPPHGGKLVNRVLAKVPDARVLATLPKVRLDQKKQMDVEQIAVGAYSPLEGFMGQEDFLSVVSNMRLANGIAWPLPIVLDVSDEAADRLTPGNTVGLTDENDDVVALLHLAEKYHYDKHDMIVNVFGTDSTEHPGVRAAHAMQPVLLAGQVDLIKGRRSATRAYELSPRQLRRLFEDRGWSTVLGFHTRNVPHRGHEFIQLSVLQDETCDGLLVQPVIGQKKPGDYKPEYIIRCYETLIEEYYPKERAVLAAFATYSRYAGPREAIFTALCRKNCGCSHFIVGRDHTGVGNWYDPYASQRIFDEFPDLGITVVKCGELSYSPALDSYVSTNGARTNGTATNGVKTNGAATNGVKTNGAATNGAKPNGSAANGHGERVQLISGSQARAMFVSGERPPTWFMRPEVSQIVLAALANGEEVFEN